MKKEKNPIIKVVFYEVEFEGEKYREAAIFRKDGVSLEDKEAGIDALYELAKDKGFKTMDELKNSDCYEVLSEEMLKDKFPNIYNTAKCETKEDEILPPKPKKETFKRKKKKKEKPSLNNILDKFHIKSFLLRSSIYLIAGGFALFGGFHLGKKVYNHFENKKNTSQEDENNNRKDNATTGQDDQTMASSTEYETAIDMLTKYESFDQILEKSEINQTKSNTVSNIWSYLKNYNKNISTQHRSSVSDTRLAHTWDEAVVNYLAYNDISKDEVNKIFDNYNININLMKDAYNNGYNQDLLAYTVLKEPTNKIDLIKLQEGKDFYKKYEDLIIEYNKKYDKEYEDVEKIVNKFYETIRADFDINKSTEEIESYKLSVVPIIDAFDSMLENRNFDIQLTTEEKAYFDSLANYSQIESKITNLSNSLYAYHIAIDTLDTLDEFTEEYSYSQLKDAAITELDLEHAYNVYEGDRDISDHSEYKEKFIVEEKIKKQETNTSKSGDSSSHNNSGSGSDTDDAGMADDEKEDKIPDWMLEGNEQSNGVEEEKQTEEESEEKDIYIYDVEEDTPTTPEVTEDTNYKNQDNSIKNITTDDANVSPTVSLPDPNNGDTISNFQLQNEVVADYIITEMANNPVDFENGYQYTKK